MNILKLTIKKKWFDMILSGEKKEEYRNVSKFYESRFMNKEFTPKVNCRVCKHYTHKPDENPCWEWKPDCKFDYGKLCLNFQLHGVYRNYDAIQFFNGGYFSEKLPNFTIKLNKINIGIGKKEWGAIDEEIYFILQLGKIIKYYTNEELIEMVNEQFDYFKKFGDRHYSDTKDEQILEKYWDIITGKVMEGLEIEEEQVDVMYERIASLF